MKVYRAFAEQSADLPGFDDMALRLAVSPRTLRRQLQSEGTSYRQLLVAFRMQLAHQYLLETNLKIEDIAELVGYANAANFFRVFRAEHGATPSAYRSHLATT